MAANDKAELVGVAARAQGLKVLTGLAMLVYQGAIGFEMWTGHSAPEVVMKNALRRAFRV